MNVLELYQALNALEGQVPLDLPVRLIVDGTAYPVDDVWFEPRQDGNGALCIGEDLR